MAREETVESRRRETLVQLTIERDVRKEVVEEQGVKERTERDGVDLALDLDHRSLDVVDVDDLVKLGLVNQDHLVVLVVLL